MLTARNYKMQSPCGVDMFPGLCPEWCNGIQDKDRRSLLALPF